MALLTLLWFCIIFKNSSTKFLKVLIRFFLYTRGAPPSDYHLAMLTPSLFASISISLIAKDIDFQFIDNSISCEFRYDLPIDLNLIIQSNATDMTKSCITNRLLNSIVIKLVKLNVPFVFKNKTIEFDFRENTDIATISPLGDNVLITTLYKGFFVIDSLDDLRNYHPFAQN